MWSRSFFGCYGKYSGGLQYCITMCNPLHLKMACAKYYKRPSYKPGDWAVRSWDIINLAVKKAVRSKEYGSVYSGLPTFFVCVISPVFVFFFQDLCYI